MLASIAHRTPHTAHRTPCTAHCAPHTVHRTPHTAHRAPPPCRTAPHPAHPSRCWHPDADGMVHLHAHYNKQATADQRVSFHVYHRLAHELCKAEDVDDIHPRGYDHNICAVCERKVCSMHELLEKKRLLNNDRPAGARTRTNLTPCQPQTARRAGWQAGRLRRTSSAASMT